MRYFITVPIVLSIIEACSPTSQNETSLKECLPMIDNAVASLQKYEFSRDTSQVDSAIAFYDKAIECDPSNGSGRIGKVNALALVGRFRESIVVIRNAYKVHEVSPLAHAEFLMLQGVLYERLDQYDSSKMYLRQSLTAFDNLLDEGSNDSLRIIGERAWALGLLSGEDKAKTWLEPYLERHPDDKTLKVFVEKIKGL